MSFEKQLKLNSYLAILFGILIISGETIRRYGEWGHWSWWIDDYMMGSLLIVSAIIILGGYEYGRPLLIAGWGFSSGLLYGSFFSKVTSDDYNFQSNIEPAVLVNLIGLAFVTSVLALLWLLIIEKKRTKK